MNSGAHGAHVYLLVDNGLLAEASASYVESNSNDRPAWLVPIYAEQALEVSPLLIDVGASYELGHLDQLMAYLNACTPALHVSIIETDAGLEQTAQHLRRFIFILDPDGKQFTLRFADCAVLESLVSVLTEAQWTTMRGSTTRWLIHDRSGAIVALPSIEVSAAVPTPLCLDREQLMALDEASEADHCVAKVKMMRHGAPLPGNAAAHHRWAKAAIQAWQHANNRHSLVLTFLTEAAITTQGQILLHPEINDALAMDDVRAFRGKLLELSANILR